MSEPLSTLRGLYGGGGFAECEKDFEFTDSLVGGRVSLFFVQLIQDGQEVFYHRHFTKRARLLP